MLASLTKPCQWIVPFLGAFVRSDELHIVLAMADGGSLLQLVRSGRRLENSLLSLAQIAAGMAYLQQLSIWHCSSIHKKKNKGKRKKRGRMKRKEKERKKIRGNKIGGRVMDENEGGNLIFLTF